MKIILTTEEIILGPLWVSKSRENTTLRLLLEELLTRVYKAEQRCGVLEKQIDAMGDIP